MAEPSVSSRSGSSTVAGAIIRWAGRVGPLALAGALGLFLLRRGADAANDLREVRAELSALQTKLDRRVREHRTKLGPPPSWAASPPEPARLEPAPSASNAARPPWQEELELSQEEQEYRIAAAAQAKLREFERAFTSEQVDVAWSDKARRELEDKYRADDLRALTTVVECRATLCRVGFTFSDAAAAMDVAPKLQASPPWPGPASMAMDLDKKQGATFIAREGFELPPFDPASVTF